MLFHTTPSSLVLHPDLDSAGSVAGVNPDVCLTVLFYLVGFFMHFVISIYQWESNRIRILDCCTNVVLKSSHLEIQISRYRGEAKK